MTQQVVNVGSLPGDGTGDKGQVPFNKVNANDAELYAKAVFVGSDSGVANAYVIAANAFSPQPATAIVLAVGIMVGFTPSFANTGPSTLAFAGTGTINIVDPLGLALDGAELLTTAPTLVRYNGAAWQIIVTNTPDLIEGLLSAALLAPFVNRQRTAAEIAAGVVPTNFAIPSHATAGGCYLERYGGGNGALAATNDAAFALALLVAGQLDLPIFLSAGASSWQFSAPWVMTGTGQAFAGIGTPPGGAGVTGCRVLGIGGRPILQFNSIGAGVDCITLGGSNLPQVELRNLQINCNTTGRDGVVILGSNLPIVDNILIENSTRDSFVLSPNGTTGQWIEKGRFAIQIRFAGRHAVNMSLLGTLNPFINECVWDLLEVRGVSVITAGGNAIACSAVGGLGVGAKIADHVFVRTLFDASYNTGGIVPDTSPVKVYSGIVQNPVFISPAWENTGTAGLVGGAGTFYNISTNAGAGSITGLMMIAALTNSFWSNTGPDPLIVTAWNFDYSYAKTQLVSPVQIGTLSAIYTSTGGPPASGTGVNGDFAFRQDGGTGTCIYQKRAGAWVATGA